MRFTIKKSHIPAWGYEITAPGFHNVAPSIDSALQYLNNRYGDDVQIRIIPDTTGLTKFCGMSQVFLRGVRQYIKRAVYTDGTKMYVNYGGYMIEVRQSDHYMDRFITIEEY